MTLRLHESHPPGQNRTERAYPTIDVAKYEVPVYSSVDKNGTNHGKEMSHHKIEEAVNELLFSSYHKNANHSDFAKNVPNIKYSDPGNQSGVSFRLITYDPVGAIMTPFAASEAPRGGDAFSIASFLDFS